MLDVQPVWQLFRRPRISQREALARVLRTSRLFNIAKLLGPNRLIIFNYHRISQGDGAQEPFDDGVFETDQETFRRELLAMKKHGIPVSEDEVIESLDRDRALPRRSFMVTFDDGYRDCFDRALPILRELKIPAVFFIPTQSIDERRIGWWDLYYWYLKQCPKDAITLRGERYSLAADSLADSAWRIRAKLMRGPGKDMLPVLQELGEACEVREPSFELRDRALMTWDQIRESSRAGITIGSHTHSHPILSRIGIPSQREELVRSKRILEERLGKPIRSIAYPVGGYKHFNTETKELAREAGYRLAYSFSTGTNLAGALDRFDIRRIGPQPSAAVFEGVFSIPSLFARRTCPEREPSACAYV